MLTNQCFKLLKETLKRELKVYVPKEPVITYKWGGGGGGGEIIKKLHVFFDTELKSNILKHHMYERVYLMKVLQLRVKETI